MKMTVLMTWATHLSNSGQACVHPVRLADGRKYSIRIQPRHGNRLEAFQGDLQVHEEHRFLDQFFRRSHCKKRTQRLLVFVKKKGNFNLLE